MVSARRIFRVYPTATLAGADRFAEFDYKVSVEAIAPSPAIAPPFLALTDPSLYVWTDAAGYGLSPTCEIQPNLGWWLSNNATTTWAAGFTFWIRTNSSVLLRMQSFG